MFRFFTTPESISGNLITLSEEDSKHIRSLRLRPDEQFFVCDGEGTDYICTLGKREDCSVADIIDKQKSSGEPTITCRVFIAFTQGERLDYAVQKSVELGVNEIILFESERCVSVPRDIPKKIARLQRIALETAKLANRGKVPTVSSCGKFAEMVDKAVSISDFTIFFYESEDDLHIKSVLEKQFPSDRKSEEHSTKSVSLITGPVGGFEAHEVEYAKSKQIPVVSLGPRILRAETAPSVALATIMYQTGNL